MNNIIFAWVLVLAPGAQSGGSVSDIASKAECIRLANEMGWYKETGFYRTFECYRYQKAK